MLHRSSCRQAGPFFLLYSHNGQQRHTPGSLALSGNNEETMAESVSLSLLSVGDHKGKPKTEREKERPLNELHTLYSPNGSF